MILLRFNGAGSIETTVHIYKGTEWVAWSLDDAEKAEDILGYDDWKKTWLKQQREARQPADNIGQ